MIMALYSDSNNKVPEIVEVDTEIEMNVDIQVKVKRHRRGKKFRKAKPYDNTEVRHDVVKSNPTCSNAGNGKAQSRREDREGGLRPRYSPQAPRNYTQYIIDDQLGSPDGDGGDVQLETFLASQFEAELEQHRLTELASKSQPELVSIVNSLQGKVSALESQLLTCQPCKEIHQAMKNSDICRTVAGDNDDSSSDSSDSLDNSLDEEEYYHSINGNSSRHNESTSTNL